MAAVAVPLIEAVVMRVLAALGLGAAAGATGEAAKEAARQRQEEADKAKSSPIARAQTKAREKCKECPPDKGSQHTRTFPASKPWVEYQARIGGMPYGPTFILEWRFNGVDFDGFVSAECLLKEAKGSYDNFFNDWGEVLKWWEHNVEELMKEISRQSLAALPRPPVRLEWFWQQPMSYRYFSRVLGPIAPDVPHHYHP